MMLNIFAKFLILDVWRLQTSRLTLRNEKKALIWLLIPNWYLPVQKSGIETLEQVEKYVQSLYC